jgi:hypothetical protein
MDPEVHSERIAILEVHQQQFRTDLSTATMLLTRSAERLDNAALKITALEVSVVASMGEIKRNLESHEHRSNTERSVHTAAIQSIQGRLDRRSGQMDAVSDAEKKREGTIDGIFAKNAPKIILALLLTLVAVLTGHASAPDAGEVAKTVLKSMQEGK